MKVQVEGNFEPSPLSNVLASHCGIGDLGTMALDTECQL